MGLSPNDMFVWMPKEHMCVLVYLVCNFGFNHIVIIFSPFAKVTVLHSMQSGYMEKAQKYTEKALIQIDKLRGLHFLFCL